MDQPLERPSDLDREKAELARRAYGVMDDSFIPIPPHLLPSYRLWHYPAAGPQLSWTVFQQRLEGPVGVPLVRRISWDRDGDFERLELRLRRHLKLDPTLGVIEQDLDPKEYITRITRARELPMARSLLASPYTADRKPEFGLDGFDIEGSDGRPIVRVEWDSPPSQDLAHIAEWAAEVRSWLEGVSA